MLFGGCLLGVFPISFYSHYCEKCLGCTNNYNVMIFLNISFTSFNILVKCNCIDKIFQLLYIYPSQQSLFSAEQIVRNSFETLFYMFCWNTVFQLRCKISWMLSNSEFTVHKKLKAYYEP